MRLIDADEIENKAVPMDSYDGFWSGPAIKLSVIRKSPTIDAAPVVRCWECKHYKPDIGFRKSCFNDLWNQEFTVPTEPDDFCSYGERMDGDG